MMERNRSDTLHSVWEKQRIWSQVANRIKKSIETWRGIALILGITGAVFETLAAQISVSFPVMT